MVLIVCLLLLPACKGGQTPLTDDPAQSTGQSEEISNSQPENTGTENLSQSGNNALPETLEFRWKNAFLKLEDAVNITEITNGKLLTFQSLSKHMEELINMYPLSEDFPYLNALKNHPYPKDFFQEHSLILIGLNGKFAAWEVTDVRYADGVLKCFVTGSMCKIEIDPDTHFNVTVVQSGCTYCFVEIDTILPEGTQIEVEINEKMLSETDFHTKLEQFKKKCLYDELKETLK